jgi:magnesium transporter
MRFYRRFTLADDETEGVGLLFWQRIPWLLFGLLGGIGMTLLVAHYEKVITGEIRLAFFLPIIVYLSDAVGTQTEAIIVRGLSRHRPHIFQYLAKETSLGVVLGVVFGLLVGGFAYFWFKDSLLGLTVGLTMLINITLATIIASLIPLLIYRENRDPALGAGPIATVVQDFVSIFIYFAVASAVLFTFS